MSAVDNGSETPLGRIPDDWTLTTVGDEYYIQLGKMLDAEKNQGELKPYLGNKAVQWGQISVDDLPMMRMSKRDQERYRLNAGDILVCEGGDVGRAAIWNEPISGVFYQKALHRLRPKRGYNSHLLIALLHRFSINGDLSDFVTQTSIAHLSKEKFATVPLPMPSADEQNAIATALKDLDDLIASLDALIAKKRDIKQAAMQQLLTGKTRLARFECEWESCPLGEVLRVRHGRDQKAVQRPNGCFPILATGGEIGRTDTPLYSKPSVLIGRKGTIDRPQYMDQPFWTVDTLFYTEIMGKNSPRFLFYVFQTIDWKSFNEASGVPSLSSKTIEGIVVNLPEPEEQIAIAATLADFDQEIEEIERRSAKFRALKDGMMQQLLTGRIRLV